MTFKPTELPKFSGAAFPTSQGSVVDMKKAKQAVKGAAAAQILACKYMGVIRPKNGEPWTAQKLLLVSAWGASEYLDLTPDKVPYKRAMTLEDCKRFEPGTVKYYIVLLPGSESTTRALGDTPIACQHLADGKSFDLLEQALEEYEK